MKFGALILLAILAAMPVFALPNMIRLGYPNCMSCHVTPQGGGLLNTYGKGIDAAQSWRAEEYKPSSIRLAEFLRAGGRVDQDFRVVTSEQVNAVTNGAMTGINRSRFFYRNVTTLGKGFRVSAIVSGEPDPILRKPKAYDPVVRPGGLFAASAMLSYRPKEGMEFAAGRDMLPQGLIIPDQTTFIKARNRLGYYDVPTQAKAIFWGKRWLVAPFAFAPSYRELRPARESGGGFMAEADLLGKGKTIVGINALRGSDHLGHRAMTGVYTRLGFGSWGILAEHDLTQRHLNQAARFAQQATYLQTFRYWKEWLATSVILERLSVQQPYSEHLWAYKGDVTARLSQNFTVSLRAGTQRDVRTGAFSPIASVQLTMKSVN